MNSQFNGDILSVRAIEDSIRATRKYTKGAFSRKRHHPDPTQGDDFPSKVLMEYYEVYPDLELSWNMPAAKAIDWLWGDVTHIDVRFRYDYRRDKAWVTVQGGPRAVKELEIGIPGFTEALAATTEDGSEAPEQPRVGMGDRIRVSPVPDPQLGINRSGNH